jgi:hypothetical protein
VIAAGFCEASQVGSHVKVACIDERGVRTAIVPRHREIAVQRSARFFVRLGSRLTNGSLVDQLLFGYNATFGYVK